MMAMGNCRLCLKSRKKLISLNDNNNGVTYWFMVKTISDIKLFGNDIDEKCCTTCCGRLQEAYSFKQLIESSNATLTSSSTKRIIFNDFKDIKVKKEIPEEPDPFQDRILRYIKTDAEEFSYNGTLVKKVKEENKPLTVVEFLNSIKEQSDESYDEGCEVDIEFDPYDDKGCNTIKAKKVQKNKNLRQRKMKDTERIVLEKPIKPTLINHIRLSYKKTDVTQPKKKIKRRFRPGICDHCGKYYKELPPHLLTHTNEYKYKCDKCAKLFKSKSTLASHYHRHGSKTIKCELCVAAFYEKKDLDSHMKYHSTEKRFVCEICTKDFKKYSQMKRHKALKHLIGVTEHKCDRCDKVCKTTAHLKHHYRVHTRERPYNCEICSQPYSYKHDFNRHCLKKHGVLFKRRSVYVMNEEVLAKERALMRDLMLRINGVVKDDLPLNPFEGPQSAMAYQQMMKYLESKQLPVDFQI